MKLLKRILFLALLFWCLLGFWYFATKAQDLPPTQDELWSDGALEGNRLILFVSLDGKATKKPIVFRLVGTEAPQSTGGGITQDLADRSTSMLSNQISTNQLEAQFLAVTKLYGTNYALDENTHLLNRFAPYKTFLEYSGFLSIPDWESHPTKAFKMGRIDLGLLLLKTGWLKVSRTIELELFCCPDVAKAYREAQNDARLNQRGIWFRWGWIFRDEEIERNPTNPLTLPRRYN